MINTIIILEIIIVMFLIESMDLGERGKGRVLGGLHRAPLAGRLHG